MGYLRELTVPFGMWGVGKRVHGAGGVGGVGGVRKGIKCNK